jgi:hypothetical protein
MTVCEHGDHPAPDGKRFCSASCEECEHTLFAMTGCSGICLEIQLAEARSIAALLAHAYDHDTRPPHHALAKARTWKLKAGGK